jgi:hypothetical protein
MTMTATKRPRISGERPDDDDEDDGEEAGDKYEYRQKGPKTTTKRPEISISTLKIL